MADFHADQTHKHSLFIELRKEFLGSLQKHFVRTGVRYNALTADRIEIGIAKLYCDTATEFIFLAKLKTHFLRHSHQLAIEKSHVDGVRLKGIFRADAFLLGVGNHGRFVDSIGFSGKVDP